MPATVVHRSVSREAGRRGRRRLPSCRPHHRVEVRSGLGCISLLRLAWATTQRSPGCGWPVITPGRSHPGGLCTTARLRGRGIIPGERPESEDGSPTPARVSGQEPSSSSPMREVIARRSAAGGSGCSTSAPAAASTCCCRPSGSDDRLRLRDSTTAPRPAVPTKPRLHCGHTGTCQPGWKRVQHGLDGVLPRARCGIVHRLRLSAGPGPNAPWPGPRCTTLGSAGEPSQTEAAVWRRCGPPATVSTSGCRPQAEGVRC
jgi:hypothetical protein